tara:strand:- start:123 stop:1649 length:1527 start_codon:yes stop_codon:yes gene_type:complete
MANITIVKLKVRRGTDAQRKTIVLDQGEVGYTLDTKRLFVGDGAKLGGNVIGNNGLGTFTSLQSLGDTVGAQVGDIGYANSSLFMLTSIPYEWNSGKTYLSGFAYIGTKSEDATASIAFDSDGRVTVKKDSLDAAFFKSGFFGDGVLSGSDGDITPALNSQYLVLSSDADDARITPKENSITKREIATSALSSGLVGGNDKEIKLQINYDTFNFNDEGDLILQSLGSNSVLFSSFAPGAIGDGLTLNSTTKQLEATFKSTTDALDLTDGVLSIASGVSANEGTTNTAPELPYVSVSDGIVTALKSSIYDTVTATGLSGVDTGDEVPVGTVLPHARAFANIPAGYLLCDGKAYDSALAQYKDLYDVIGSNWNTAYNAVDPGGTMFRVPNLTGGDVLMYGANTTAPGATTYKLSATTSTAMHELSTQGYNFIIRYSKGTGDFDLFNGAPNQVSQQFLGKYDQKTYDCLDSAGSNIQLSSAGFVLFALSGDVRNSTSSETFDKFAIPVYNW